MITLIQAKAIFDDTRAFFRAGAKSANKAYVASAEEWDAVTAADEPIPKGTPGITKEQRRNRNASFAEGEVFAMRVKNKSIGSAVAYGAVIHGGEMRYGNCTEMASVAAYLVSKKDKKVDITIASTDWPGDHVFCVVGPTGKWKTVEEVPPAAAESIIIDPWANICCLAPGYLAAFTTKMGKWLGAGKRIGGPDFSWLAPDGEYLRKFRASTIGLVDARKTPLF